MSKDTANYFILLSESFRRHFLSGTARDERKWSPESHFLFHNQNGMTALFAITGKQTVGCSKPTQNNKSHASEGWHPISIKIGEVRP